MEEDLNFVLQYTSFGLADCFGKIMMCVYTASDFGFNLSSPEHKDFIVINRCKMTKKGKKNNCWFH